jgi:Zn-dependent protease
VAKSSPGSIPLFRIRGIPVEISYSWILIFVLVSVNLASGWFPATLPNRPAFLYYLLGAISAILLFVCVLAHELSHSLVAIKEGQQVHGIVLHVFGGVSLIEEKQYTAPMEFKVAIAGPILSIVLGFVFYSLRKFLFSEPHSIGYAVLSYLFVINFVLAIFNLLPGFPLDGGRILRSILYYWKKDLLKATKIASRVGVGLAFLLMAYGAIAIFRGYFGGFWTILIGIFLRDAAESTYRQAMVQNTFRGMNVEQIMHSSPVVIPPDISIQQLIDDYFWRYHYGSFPVGNSLALGIIPFTSVKKLSLEDRQRLRVRDVMRPIDDSLRIGPQNTVVEAFQKAMRNGIGRLIVTDGNDGILGYLSLRDIGKAFQDQNRGELLSSLNQKDSIDAP